MIEVEVALDLVDGRTFELEAERVPLECALGRVLRQNVLADIDSPAFDASAMDGYAIRPPASAEGFRCIAEIAAGSVQEISLNAGECARIFTGAKVPAYAERVVMQENVDRVGDLMQIVKTDTPAYIRKRGENCRRGDVVVAAGAIISPVELAAIASCGVTQLQVTRPARVIHIVTGDELIDPGQQPGGTQIRDSNSILVRAFLESAGADLARQVRVGDDMERARAFLADAAGFDLLLISGGASVGRHDIAKPLLREAGFEPVFEKVNLRPGKPLVFATRDQQLAFAIPGNPVSHWVVLELVIAAAIRKLHGDTTPPAFRSGRLERDFPFRSDARHTYWPCVSQWADGGYRLAPLPFVSSGDITGLAGANALLAIEPGRNFISSSERIEFLLCQHGF